MRNKYHWLHFFIPSIFLASAQHPQIYIPNFCYNDRYKGSRLNTTLFTTTHVDEQLDCLIVCDQEPCCRSINFKNISSSPLEKNCEMLHNVVHKTSEQLLETDPSFDHLYFISSEKEYNASCLVPRGTDECSMGSHSCHVNARCVETIVSYHCECLSGYHGDGYNCTDIDECSEATSNYCDLNAKCINTNGSYNCACRIGYTGNGKECSDIDECSGPTTSNDCHLNAKCINTNGSYNCACHIGYAGNGKECLDIDECSEPTSNHCDLNATCVNTNASYNCTCNIGFTGNGKECSDQFIESTILANEPVHFREKLNEWLPETGGWRRCWRGTEHGWGGLQFHGKCDWKIPTLVIIKVVKNAKNFIFGGYSTRTWAEGGGTSAPGSFMFSLRNNDNLEPFKAPLKDENDKNAIRRQKGNGPIFGWGHDLNIANNAGSNYISFANFGGSYQSPSGYNYREDNTKSLLAGSYNFQPSEIEVLYLN